MSIKALQDYTYYSKYARYNKTEKRRETWNEAVDRVKNMHLQKYAAQIDKSPEILEDINWAFDMVREKRVLGSQRALQFGGEPILKKNARIYNCCTSYCDRIKFFQECFWLLLCGTGCGFSVQKHHVAKLPKFTTKCLGTKKFLIPDSIEGWSDSLGVLLATYFPHPDFPTYEGCRVEFDYSLIRPAGSPISSGNGKAPGPDALRRSLEIVRRLLDGCLGAKSRLRPIDAYDIIMHTSDAVLSGGVRRSACICLFSIDDEEMINAKTGNWFVENPQRGRSNNSVVLLRDKTTKEDFLKIIEAVKEFGEPGFVWVDNLETTYNPCVIGSTVVTTTEGLKTVYELQGQKFAALVDSKAYPSNGFSATGVKEVIELEFASGRTLTLTPDHKVMTITGWKEASELTAVDEVIIHRHADFTPKININSGDFTKGYHAGSFFARPAICGSWDYLVGVVSGCFNAIGLANGSFVFKELNNLRNLQIILNSLGICSKICLGELRIHDITRFLDLVPITDQKKLAKLKLLADEKLDYTDRLIKVTAAGKQPVFDAMVEDVNAFDANGIYVHNCVEISLYPQDDRGQSGFAFCNLCEINGKKVKSREDWIKAAKAGAIIGTLQAGYTDFEYLGSISESIAKREALLGVSITGMMDNPDILFNPELQREMAKLILRTNEQLAVKLGIRPTARATCIKPSGTTSCVLGTGSGIHPHHARRYLRRVQGNSMEAPLQWFKEVNPHAVEKSVWSANGTDEIVTFCIEVPEGGKVKNDLDALTLLEHVKLTQQNWVASGRVQERCVQPWLMHNVSNTINVYPEEWDEVGKFIFDNRKFFAGISLLPISGDKDYPQAPMSAIFTPRELVTMYGDGQPLASGLIVDGLKAFDNNLWKACDAVMGLGEPLVEPKPIYDAEGPQEASIRLEMHVAKRQKRQKWQERTDWVRRAKQFAERYFEGNIRNMTYCLKDTNNWKLWLDLNREYKDVDYTTMLEDSDETKPLDTVACGGQGCQLF